MEAYAYGGLVGDGTLDIKDCILTVRLHNESGRASTYSDKNKNIEDGCRGDYFINGNTSSFGM